MTPTDLHHAEHPIPDISVIIPISEAHGSLEKTYFQYAQALDTTEYSYEFIFVLDGKPSQPLRTLMSLKQEHPEIVIITLSRQFGEATALAVGLSESRGTLLLTLPPYPQIEPGELPKLLQTLINNDHDLVIAWRHPRIDSRLNRIQSWISRRLIGFLTGTPYHDVSCSVRAMKREVGEEVPLYGDLHRFFPLLAYQRGFRIAEVPARQAIQEAKPRVHKPGVYFGRLLDILTLFFLFKFTKRPLRFFGLIGSVLFGGGTLITAYLGIYRLLRIGGIAGRPLLILGVLLMVLGIQLFSIGLLGEIIIFTHARELKDYTIDTILR